MSMAKSSQILFCSFAISYIFLKAKNKFKPDEDSFWVFAINTVIKIDQKWTLHSWMFMIMPVVYTP